VARRPRARVVPRGDHRRPRGQVLPLWRPPPAVAHGRPPPGSVAGLSLSSSDGHRSRFVVSAPPRRAGSRLQAGMASRALVLLAGALALALIAPRADRLWRAQ